MGAWSGLGKPSGGASVLPDVFYERADWRICGGIGEKDDIETEGVMVSEGDWAGQTG